MRKPIATLAAAIAAALLAGCAGAERDGGLEAAAPTAAVAAPSGEAAWADPDAVYAAPADATTIVAEEARTAGGYVVQERRYGGQFPPYPGYVYEPRPLGPGSAWPYYPYNRYRRYEADRIVCVKGEQACYEREDGRWNPAFKATRRRFGEDAEAALRERWNPNDRPAGAAPPADRVFTSPPPAQPPRAPAAAPLRQRLPAGRGADGDPLAAPAASDPRPRRPTVAEREPAGGPPPGPAAIVRPPAERRAPGIERPATPVDRDPLRPAWRERSAIAPANGGADRRDRLRDR